MWRQNAWERNRGEQRGIEDTKRIKKETYLFYIKPCHYYSDFTCVTGHVQVTGYGLLTVEARVQP